VALTLPQGAEKGRVVEAMFDRIAPRYDLVNEFALRALLAAAGFEHCAKRRFMFGAAQLVVATRREVACGARGRARAVW
jgi:hypothetical protein